MGKVVEFDEVYGIKKFLSDKGISNWQLTIRQYAREQLGLAVVPKDEAIAGLIHDNFGAFSTYITRVQKKQLQSNG